MRDQNYFLVKDPESTIPLFWRSNQHAGGGWVVNPRKATPYTQGGAVHAWTLLHRKDVSDGVVVRPKRCFA